MRIGLIGCEYHWGSYREVLKVVPEAHVAAVAPGRAGASLDPFARAEDITDAAKRYASPEQLLDEAALDCVQISTEFARMGPLAIAAARRRLPVVIEKPLAFDLETLARVHEAFEKDDVPLFAMQGMLGDPLFLAAQQAVKRGAIGTPYASHHQKSYRWHERPASWKDRRTFPGFIPWVGIHAFAWMQWVLGDVFVEVAGWEGGALHPEVPGCATQAGLVLRMENGGFASVSLDYLRPSGAPTHGDERMRVAGSRGVLEVRKVEGRCELIAGTEGPRTLRPQGEAVPPYVQFIRHLQGQGAPPMERWEALRVTEIALLAQRAAESGKSVSLTPTKYGPKV